MKHNYIKNAVISIVLLLGLISAIESPSFFIPGIDKPTAIAPYLNSVFSDETPTKQSFVSDGYKLVNAFPNLTFIDPVNMLEMPSGNEFLILGLQGHMWKISTNQNATQKKLLFDISPNVVVNSDGGMLGFALHPDYGKSGSPNSEYIYVFYRYTPVQGTDRTGAAVKGYMRLSRFNLPVGADKINTGSEYVMINIFDRHDWHNGGDMFFHPDNGFLYLVVGDEGGIHDSYNVTQQINKYMYGGILRIDVDRRGGAVSHPIRKQPLNSGTPPNGWPNSFTQGYYIPNDNPWVDSSGRNLEEFYAIGTRSPHRMAFDEETGDIWIGDIGQSTMEEVSIARKGDNMQWPYREGTVAGRRSKPANLIGTDRPPIHVYGRSVGRAVIGGFVYRGDRFASLKGKYIFGDHETQQVWTLTKTGENTGQRSTLLRVPFEGTGSKDGISSFYSDTKGNIFILDLFGTGRDGGKIHKLSGGFNVPDPPAKLSELGAFKNLDTLEPIDGIIPYNVNAPLWSDGAKKRRWVAIPNNGTHNTAGEQIIFKKEENWIFPPGTVAIKHFELPTDMTDPSKITKIETRFLVFTKNGDAYGVTYKWNDEQTDAFLIGIDEEVSQEFAVKQLDGSTKTQKWDFPSRNQCMQCHTGISGYGLGLKTRQLNGSLTYPSGQTSNQLETWNHLNIFSDDIGSTADLPASANLKDPLATNEMKIRSYIDANCAHCHRPDGVEGAFDGRSLTAFYKQMMANTAVASRESTPGHQIIKPGDAENSMLFMRDNSLGVQKMPPVGRNLVDQEYVDLLRLWIDGLDEDTPSVVEEGLYSFKAGHSQKYLAVKDGALSENTPVVQILEANGAAEWYLTNVNDGLYRITAKGSNMVLAPKDLRAGPFSPLVQQPWKNEQHQLWKFNSGPDGYYRISNAYNNMQIGVFQAGQDENAPSTLSTPEDALSQQWKLEILSTKGLCSNSIATKLSDLSWESVSQGYGKPYKNGNLGGGPMKIQGKTFNHGIATHADSRIVYKTSGKYQKFSAQIGLDDTAGDTSWASVQFEVVGDGKSLYRSATKFARNPAEAIDVDITGVNTLILLVHGMPNQSPSSDPINTDHADWALATLIACQEDNSENLALNKPTAQSSLWASAVSSRAVDGNTNGNYRNNSITHTGRNQNAWWRVDLGNTYEISAIRIFNRTDCCSNRLNNTDVYIGATAGTRVSDYRKVGALNGNAEQNLTPNATGRYVFIRKNDRNYLSLSEVEVYGKLAPCANNIATKLSDLSWESISQGYGKPNKNGNLNGGPMRIQGKTFNHGIATHANSKIVYRIGGKYQKFTAFIGIDDTAGDTSPASVQFEVIGDGKSLYRSATKYARNSAEDIEVDITGVNTLILLAHEMPNASPKGDPKSNDHADWALATLIACQKEKSVNLALNKPTVQSSRWASAGPQRAVDGNTNGNYRNNSVTHTGRNQNAWWRVDLGNTYEISAIRIFNRTDCCSNRLNNTDVYIGATASTRVSDYRKVGALNGNAEQNLTPNATGRYVFIRKNDRNYLSLSEVEVYGKLAPCANSTTKLSALGWSSVAQGWGKPSKNRNLQGGTMKIQGQTFAHGIATHANSRIVYNIGGTYQKFAAQIGLDDTAADNTRGSVQFEVIGDGKSLYRSTTKFARNPAESISVDITGVKTLTLLVHGMPNQSPSWGPINYDHADWAAATLTRCQNNAIALKASIAANDFYFRDIETSRTSHELALKWEVENDTKIDTYVVERSVNGSNYVVVGDQLSLASKGKSDYFDTDVNPIAGKAYYRIKAIDTNGKVYYSHEVEVDFEASNSRVILFPNPVAQDQKLTADIMVEKEEDLTLHIYSMAGKVLWTKTKEMKAIQAFEEIDIRKLNHGVYLLEVRGSDWSQTKQFIVK